MKFRRRVFSSSFSFLVSADRDGVWAADRRNVYVGAVFLRAGRRNKAVCRMGRHNTADRNMGRLEEDIDRRRRAAEEGIDYCSAAEDIADAAAEPAADIVAEVVEAAESEADIAAENAETAAADVDIAAACRNIPALREVYILSAYCGCHYYFCLYFCLP